MPDNINILISFIPMMLIYLVIYALPLYLLIRILLFLKKFLIKEEKLMEAMTDFYRSQK